MPRVLVSDKLSTTAVQIFKDRGVEVDYLPDLGKDKDKLLEVIGQYDGLAIRSATKITEKLIAAMEGMSFETPKGRMTFRKDDHQAMQAMYHFKIKVDPSVQWAIPELVREIKPEDMKVPIRTKP